MAGTRTTSICSYNFWRDSVLAGGGGYVDNGPYAFVDQVNATPFLSGAMHFVNDGATDLFWSFDGVNDMGRVAAGQQLPQLLRRERRIWFRGAAGLAYRFWAY